MRKRVAKRKIDYSDKRRTLSTPALIGVLGDSHASSSGKRWATDPVVAFFQRAGVDLILHAGDAGHPSVLRELEDVAPVESVRGNADPVELIDALPDRVWIEAGARTILLMHGHHGRTAIRAARAAAADGIDLIVFGHSHQPLIDVEGETILFNPGSHTERRWNPHFGIGLISVSDERIEPDLILFDDPRHLENVEP